MAFLRGEKYRRKKVMRKHTKPEATRHNNHKFHSLPTHTQSATFIIQLQKTKKNYHVPISSTRRSRRPRSIPRFRSRGIVLRIRLRRHAVGQHGRLLLRTAVMAGATLYQRRRGRNGRHAVGRRGAEKRMKGRLQKGPDIVNGGRRHGFGSLQGICGGIRVDRGALALLGSYTGGAVVGVGVGILVR